MKQLLFLLLFPCLALAQYPGNGNQKITLGEQTSADGLVYRGVASSDTIRKPSVDTMAFILLDTNTNIIWQYKKAVNNAWTRVGGSISSGLTGVLPVANGGTGIIAMPAGYILHGDGTSVDTSINLFFNRTNNNLGIGTNNPSRRLDIVDAGASTILLSGGIRSDITLIDQGAGTDLKRIVIRSIDGKLIFTSENDAVINSSNKVTILSGYAASGNMGIGTDGPTEKLHVVGNARISGLANAANPVNVQVDVNGVLVRTSSIDIKEDVQNLPYGLNEIMLLQPSKFSYIDKYKYGEGYDIGFIAQDVNNVIPEAVGTGIESDIFMDSVKLIPVLTKAIQEQQALIKALEQRILNLENK